MRARYVPHGAATLLLALLALSTAAHAETRAVGDGLSLSIDNHELWIVKGKQRARFASASSFRAVAVDKTKRRVTVDVEDNTCVGHTKYELTFDHLEARIENWAAYALYKAKDYKNAALGFAKASKLDPTWKIAAYNLASAHQLAGDKAAAVRSLQPHLAAEPIATYVQVTSDPDLVPLLDSAELVAIRSKQAGNAKVTDAGFEPLYAKDRNLIAFAREEKSWGSDAYTIDLQIYDAKSGALVATTPLVNWDDTRNDARGLTTAGKKAVAERAARFQTMLRQLGFSSPELEKTKVTDDGSTKMKAVFPKAKLGVVATPDVANALRGNTQVGTAKSAGKMLSAVFVEDASAVVITTHLHSAEGCDGGPEIGVYVIPIKG